MSVSIDTEGLRPGGVGKKHLRDYLNRSNSTFITRTSSATNDAAGDVAEIATLRVATTANITLSGSQTIDGVTLTDGDTVLVKNQSTQTGNGYYSYNSSGAWSRLDTTITAGQVVSVLEGTANGNKLFLCANDTNPDVGTDNITFAQVGSIDGTGIVNYVALWLDTDTLGTGQIKDDGTRVQINTTATTGKVNIGHNTSSGAVLYVRNIAASGAASALYVQNDSSTGGSYAGEFVANTSGGGGLYVHGAGSSNGIAVNTETGVGIQSNPTGNGNAFVSTRDVSGATAPLTSLHEDHAAAAATTLQATNDGLGRTSYLQRNNSSATQPVVEIYEQGSTTAQQALYVHSASTSGSANAIRAEATGGVGISAQSNKIQAGYFFRTTSATAATTEVVRIEQQYGTDANTVLLVRGDGTGDLLVCSDAGTSRLKVEDGGVVNMQGSGVRYSTRTVSASATIAKSDRIIYCDTAAAAGNITLTLPTPAAGMEFHIIDSTNNSGTRTVTLARAGSENIDNAASNKTVLNANGERCIVSSDGTDWFTIRGTRA